MNTSRTTDIDRQESKRGDSTGRLAAVPNVVGLPAEAITAGSIFIERGIHLSNSLVYEDGFDVSGWASLKGARSTFEKKLQEAGWTLFFMAGEIKATAVGSDPEALRTALKRLIVKVKSQHCNGLEVTQVTRRSFLGVPYASISAHPRHLQRGSVFAGRN